MEIANLSGTGTEISRMAGGLHAMAPLREQELTTTLREEF
jgi:hypothetical protein